MNQVRANQNSTTQHTQLTPEIKNIIRSENLVEAEQPLQTQLDARIGVREYELRCYFESILIRLRPREFDGNYTVNIQAEAKENFEALQKLLRRNNNC
jgi:hypothetical protein